MNKYFVGFLSIMAGAILSGWWIGKLVKKIEKLANKHLDLFLLMNEWINLKNQGKNIASFLEANGYKKIAVYGISTVGETLVNELKQSNIQVLYAIDNNITKSKIEIDIVSLQKKLPKVDAIIVTAITFFDEIKRELRTKTNCPVISLKDIFDEM